MEALVTDIEGRILSIDGKEYVCLNGFRDFYVQDFIRFPNLIGLEEPILVSHEHSSNILKNSKLPNVSGCVRSFHHSAIITGSSDFPDFVHDDAVILSVNRGIFHPLATYCVATDFNGSTISQMRKFKDAPIGLFEIRSSHLLASEWCRKFSAGVYKLPCQSHDFTNISASNIKTSLSGYDYASAAMSFANRHLKSWRFFLHEADLSFETERPGSVQVESRYAFPEHIGLINYLRSVCHIVLRNGGEVYWTKGTMCSVPGGRSIDKNEMQDMISEGI